MADEIQFDEWIRILDEDVVQGEYGYEPGEFVVYPEHWRPMYDAGVTPQAAFKRALDATGEARRERDRERQANWERIQREDAEATLRYKSADT